ncbi:putative GTPase activating protein for arf domain-containing protein [Ditylenchus destructor]|uniref:GTPase activating protein for arf domain-containing protein n=1 Tax=Ditylenchus destructor TaxID=166010 RepID=A0AAD4R995_9BILA|nr:putative GTPase activating protein for arf domain-containing protein [Ditylenchus destructor]
MSYSANSSSAAQRKKLEEKNGKLVRELLLIPANKFCFECGQRGPTYANVTEGSFCCMHCLNPPHRVKSISMSTFSDDDIQKMKSMGNEENAKIWLGLYDKKVKFEPRVDDEVKQHLIQKYENKRWYVSPDELNEQKELLAAHTRRDSASSFQSHQTTFAEFDIKFDSLNLSAQPKSPPSSSIQSGFIPQQRPLTQSSSIFGGQPALVPQTSDWPQISQNTSTIGKTENDAVTPVVAQPSQAPAKKTGYTSDGRPIMETPTTLPDYSALEDLFRGVSSAQQSSTTVPEHNISPFGCTPMFINSTKPNTTAAVSKSTTMGEFSTMDPWGIHAGSSEDTGKTQLTTNSFHSMAAFPSNNTPGQFTSPQQQFAANASANGTQFNTMQPNSNWNPFAS